MAEKLSCPECGKAMNCHAEKVDYGAALANPEAMDPAFGGVLEEFHCCPTCHLTVQRIRGDGSEAEVG